MNNYQLTPDQVAQYHEEGYLIVEDLFDADMIKILNDFAQAKGVPEGAPTITVPDDKGRKFLAWLGLRLGDDIYSAFVRSRRIVEPMEQLLEDRVLHFHHKMMLKQPYDGGGALWHQDYGYWYRDTFLYPTMLSAIIAVDHAVKANGCMQVVKGSHHAGRVDHDTQGPRTGTDPERLAMLLEKHELVYCEMKPGTVMYMHGNTLHQSEQNTSPNWRKLLIGSFSAAWNLPSRMGKLICEVVDPIDDDRLREICTSYASEVSA